MPKHVGFRAVHGDLSSSRGYRWPYPGNVAVAPGPIVKTNTGPCPSATGDGICIAKTWAGAASGGIAALTCLVVEYYDRDVLGEDADKVRVRKATVIEVVDVPLLGRAGYLSWANLSRANLSWANLSRANLSRADLSRANLSRADLSRANLSGADLSRADLYGANLSWADLYGANLSRADLSWANLSRANLSGANLSGANLSRANLSGANLSRADLSWANLSRANLSWADLSRADLSWADLSWADPVPTGWKRGTSGLLERA